jgi:hypothetical protein
MLLPCDWERAEADRLLLHTPSLVAELIKSALVPVINERLAAADSRTAKEAALLELRVVDPASGSGHFLLAAARTIARELARVRNDGNEPSPEGYRQALRDVVRSCLYAVDKNPLAVDLCKVALWIEGYNAGMPLNFLDNHIKWGDSLVGVRDLQVLADGIPDGAYAPVAGDQKAVAASLKKQNKVEREGQLGFWSGIDVPDVQQLAQQFRALGLAEERTPYDVHQRTGLRTAAQPRRYLVRRQGGLRPLDGSLLCSPGQSRSGPHDRHGAKLSPATRGGDGQVVGNAVEALYGTLLPLAAGVPRCLCPRRFRCGAG